MNRAILREHTFVARNGVLNCLAGAAVMIEEQKSRRKKLIISEFFPILFLQDTGRFDH